jgi:hypothetical protein
VNTNYLVTDDYKFLGWVRAGVLDRTESGMDVRRRKSDDPRHVTDQRVSSKRVNKLRRAELLAPVPYGPHRLTPAGDAELNLWLGLPATPSPTEGTPQ